MRVEVGPDFSFPGEESNFTSAPRKVGYQNPLLLYINPGNSGPIHGCLRAVRGLLVQVAAPVVLPSCSTQTSAHKLSVGQLKAK